MYIVPFNPELPFVATQPFTAAGHSFAAGDTVDWRALGVGLDVLALWWRAKLVVHPLDAQKTPEPKLYGKTRVRKGSKPTPAEVKVIDEYISDDELERLTRPE